MRDTENIPVCWKNFTSGFFLQSAFSVSISGQHLLRHQVDIKEATIARPVCLLKRARVGTLSEGNMVEATHLMRKVQPNFMQSWLYFMPNKTNASFEEWLTDGW